MCLTLIRDLLGNKFSNYQILDFNFWSKIAKMIIMLPEGWTLAVGIRFSLIWNNICPMNHVGCFWASFTNRIFQNFFLLVNLFTRQDWIEDYTVTIFWYMLKESLKMLKKSSPSIFEIPQFLCDIFVETKHVWYFRVKMGLHWIEWIV